VKPWSEKWTYDPEWLGMVNVPAPKPGDERSPEQVEFGQTDSGEARAKLAAAAPDLYLALEDCLYVLENVVDMEAGNPRGSRRVGECMAKVEAALRKARGET
jgi:hypothetical protein